MKRCLFHKYEEIRVETAKNVVFGFGEAPIMRIVLKCKKCNKIKYQSLTLGSDPYDDSLEWI